MTDKEKLVIIDMLRTLMYNTDVMLEAMEQVDFNSSFKVLTENYHNVCMQALFDVEKIK